MGFIRLFTLIGLVFLLQSNQAAETLRVAPGDTIHLGCNVSYHIPTTWIKHAADHNPVIVLAAHMGHSANLAVKYSTSPNLGVDIINRSIALRIASVNQSDLGLYYCVGTEVDKLQIGKATLLQGLEPETPALEDSEQAGSPLSFYVLYTASLGSGLLVMISAVITVHLKTRRRRAH